MRGQFIHAINFILGLERAAPSRSLDAPPSLAHAIAAIVTPGGGLIKVEVAEKSIECLRPRIAQAERDLSTKVERHQVTQQELKRVEILENTWTSASNAARSFQRAKICGRCRTDRH